MKWMAGVALALAGCTSGPHQVAGNGAMLQGVTVDQSWVALLDHDTRYSNGTHTGRLSVLPITGGTPIVLDGNSSGGTFDRGRTLWYLGGVSIVQEGTPVLPHYYGALELWMPGMTSGIKVGSIVRDYYPSLDGSTVVFMDFTSPSETAMGKLVALSSATCGTGSCQPVVIAEGILLSQAQWRISDDGKWVLATIRGANMGDPGFAVLVQPATGDAQVLSMFPGTRAPAMTKTGDTIAWVEGMSRLMTTSTATVAPREVPIAHTNLDSIAFVAPGDFVAKVRDTDPATMMLGPGSLIRVTNGVEKSLGVAKPTSLFVSQYVPGKTTNYVFYSTGTMADGTADLWLLDLGKSLGPVELATTALSPIGDGIVFSDDGGTIRWFDGYDPTTRLGYLYVTPLASPAKNQISTAALRGAGFEPGTTRLLYINAPDATTGAGVLTLAPALDKPTLVEGVGLLNFQDPRSAPPRTFYTQRSGGPGDGVWYMPQP